MSFGGQINRARVNLIGFTMKQVRGTLFSLVSRIIKESPVDTGRFRGNWQASINAPIKTQKQTTDPSGAGSIGNAGSVLQTLDAGETFYLTNNLPYANRLEFGYSKQAPAGMLRINVERVRAALERS